MYGLNDKQYSQVTDYIIERLMHMTISIYPKDDIPAVEKIYRKELEGWCWQSTTFMSVFFDNSDIVSRGNLILPSYSRGEYFHSWIEIRYENDYYVFDPSLNYLMKKDDYYQKYNVELKSQILIQKIKLGLIDLIENSKDGSVYIPGANDISDVFFRTNSKIIGELEEDKIKKLNARFYFQG